MAEFKFSVDCNLSGLPFSPLNCCSPYPGHMHIIQMRTLCIPPAGSAQNGPCRVDGVGESRTGLLDLRDPGYRSVHADRKEVTSLDTYICPRWAGTGERLL